MAGTVPVLTTAELDALSDEELARYAELLAYDVDSWTYSPVQQRAEDAAQVAEEILYGGAAGGGKSDWLLHHTYDLSMRVPGHRSLLLRKTFPELKRSLIVESILKFAKGPCHYRRSDMEWVFDNGSVIEFGHLDADEDIAKYLSAQYDFIGFDEASHFTDFQMRMVGGRCRMTIAKRQAGGRPHVAMATNPGGVGHGYLKRRFVKATNHGEFMVEDGVGRRLAFVPARVEDNPYIDPAYKQWLMSLPEVERRQYLYGDWDVFAGQYFSDFSRDLHVIDPIEIPEGWQRALGADWGYRDPFATVWVAFDGDQNAYVYREFEMPKLTPQEQALRVRALSGAERIGVKVADPSVFGRHNGIEKPIAVQWGDAGLHVARATNARIEGWTNIREYLKPDDEGKPSIFFFSTCTRTVETLTELVHDKTKIEDAAPGDDHLPDALRYALMVRPKRGPKPKHHPANDLQERVREHMERLKKRAVTRFNPQSVV